MEDTFELKNKIEPLQKVVDNKRSYIEFLEDENQQLRDEKELQSVWIKEFHFHFRNDNFNEINQLIKNINIDEQFVYDNKNITQN